MDGRIGYSEEIWIEVARLFTLGYIYRITFIDYATAAV